MEKGDAADLSISDTIRTKSGEHKKVLNLDFSYLRKKVFNFEVAGWHTYFVGILAWLVHNAKVCITEVIKKISNRLKYMGRTPGKNSSTGKKVFQRMVEEGTARLNRGKKEFWDPVSKAWRNIKEADMSHIEDAVKWWNRKGYKYGPRSDQAKEFMRNSKNYKYEYKGTNRSRGGCMKDKSGNRITYRDPL